MTELKLHLRKRKPSPFKYVLPKQRSRPRIRLSKAALAAAEAAISSEEFQAWLRRYEEFREQYPFEEFTEPPWPRPTIARASKETRLRRQ